MATKTNNVLIEFQDDSYQVSFQSAADDEDPSDVRALCEAGATADVFQVETFPITFKITLHDWRDRFPNHSHSCA